MISIARLSNQLFQYFPLNVGWLPPDLAIRQPGVDCQIHAGFTHGYVGHI
jgi:hypothetical protein